MNTDDEEAIHRVHARFVEAWSRGDAEALAALFTQDAVRVGALGDVQHGQREIRQGYAHLLGGPMAGAAVRIPRGTIRSLGPDAALWQTSMEIVPPGNRPVLLGYVVEVMRRERGEWLIAESHPKFFPPPPDASADHNRALARRFWEDAVNQGNPAVLKEIVAEDYIQHQVGVESGRAGLERFIAATITAFPDQHATMEQVLAVGDLVMTRTTIRATHTGPFMGIAATGRAITIEVIDLWRVEGNRLREHWGVLDNLRLMRQLGVIPEPSPRA